MRARLADTEPVMRFLGEVAWERMATSCERNSSRFSFPHRTGESRIAFYHEVEAALAEGPSSQRGWQLARRWDAILDSEASGDAETKASLVNAWRSRHKWPGDMRRWVSGCYMMSVERWEAVSRFLEQAAGLAA
jgi:hypothetical protein